MNTFAFSVVARGSGRGPPPPPTAVVNANVCTRTNEIYTRYMHFKGFFMPKNASAAGAPPGPCWGASNTSQTP